MIVSSNIEQNTQSHKGSLLECYKLFWCLNGQQEWNMQFNTHALLNSLLGELSGCQQTYEFNNATLSMHEGYSSEKLKCSWEMEERFLSYA